jgi:IclR family mhp operon transcriptional activator
MASFKPVTAALRILDVLQAVNQLKQAGVGDIHRLTGLNRPTVVRMLETLCHAGYVARDAQRPVYMPTGRTLELSAGYELDREIGRIGGPVIAALGRAVGWPSDLGVFDGDAMVVAQTSRGEGRLFLNRRPGYRAPLLATSLGLAFLAFCRAEDRRRALAAVAGSAEPWNAPARDPGAIDALLAAVRRQGYATMHPDYSRREYEDAVRSIGVPVLVRGEAACSINLLYLRDAMTEDEAVARYLAPLRQAAATVAAELAATRAD